jgi:hypothetical protein
MSGGLHGDTRHFTLVKGNGRFRGALDGSRNVFHRGHLVDDRDSAGPLEDQDCIAARPVDENIIGEAAIRQNAITAMNDRPHVVSRSDHCHLESTRARARGVDVSAPIF